LSNIAGKIDLRQPAALRGAVGKRKLAEVMPQVSVEEIGKT